MNSRITANAESLLQRVLNMARLVPSVECHLLEEQADAVARSSTPDTRPSGIGDPTPGLVAALAPFRWRERQLLAAIRSVDKALDDAERACTAALSGETPEGVELRCPGWNAELRARLGGCGKPLEFWTDAEGRQHNRSTLLCESCRKAEERAQLKSEN